MKPLRVHISICMLPFACSALFAQEPAFTQHDSPQTLEWVERQSNRIETILSDAMLAAEPVEVLMRLAECYSIFDAVAMAGLYCTDVRAPAEAGRRQCDIIHYRLEKDLNTKLQRAMEARRQAVLMREGSRICMKQVKASGNTGVKSFTINDLIRQDAKMAEYDLKDGLASQDFHIMSQKVEHAIRLIFDIDQLSTMMDCETSAKLAKKALMHCQAALAAPNWLEVNRSLEESLLNLSALQTASACD